MKRIGHLFEQVITFANLLAAARQAMRGKKDRLAVAAFHFHLEPELLRLQAELASGAYKPRPYRTFGIFEPKPRRICAAPIRDRVVHHALCRVLDPYFEALFIHHTYACRKNKGTHQALRQAQTYCRGHRYFLKLDVDQFFGQVHHATLKRLLARHFKDRRLLELLDQIIDHPIPDAPLERGLPIGNLTSQYLAGFYLSPLDHFIKDHRGVRAYLRYMDDLVLFADNKAVLHRHQAAIRRFLGEKLSLALKDRATQLAPVSQGLPFLGFQVFPGLVRLQRAGWSRFKQKVRAREQAFREGILDEPDLVQSVQSLLAHVQHGQTRRLRQHFFATTLKEG